MSYRRGTKMTRPILFRGFHEGFYEGVMGSKTIVVDGKEVKGEWIYGYYVKFRMDVGNPVAHYIQPLKEDERLDIIQEVIPSTVGQYTGLDDKNGKKIFESDRCRITQTCILENGHIELKNSGFYFKEYSRDVLINLSDLVRENFKIEVIDTIFDKELAKCE